MDYILFGDKNTYKDYGLFIQSLTISEAQPKEEIIDIPRKRWKFRFF